MWRSLKTEKQRMRLEQSRALRAKIFAALRLSSETILKERLCITRVRANELPVANQQVMSCEPTSYELRASELQVASQHLARCKPASCESTTLQVASCEPTSSQDASTQVYELRLCKLEISVVKLI